MSILTQHLADPRPTHFAMAQRVLFYVLGTKTLGLVLGEEILPTLISFTDASFANDPVDRKSMGGYVIFLGNSVISWSVKKHRGVQALSSTESEIIQATENTKELLWLQPLVKDLGFPEIEKKMVMFEDNQPAAHVLLQNPTHSGRSKHMDIKIKFCGEVLAKREKILLKYIPTKFNLADIFTKPLHTVRFRELRAILLQDLSEIIDNSTGITKIYTVLKDFVSSPF